VAIALAEDFNQGQKIFAKSLEVNRAEKVIVTAKGDLSEMPAQRVDQRMDLRATLENFNRDQKTDAKGLDLNLEANRVEKAAMGDPLEGLARSPEVNLEKPD
jgi:hypothetical protein